MLDTRLTNLRRTLCGFGIALLLCSAAGCNKNQGGGLSLSATSTPGPAASGGSVGYVDLDAIVNAHPLHAQLQALQDQIAVLRQQSVAQPTGMTTAQAAAYDQLQRDLQDAETKFEQDLGQRRAFYQQQEAAAISQIQASTLGQSTPGTSGVLGGLQQQYGQQAKALQTQAIATLNSYRDALFKQDGEHLRHVQQLLAQGVQARVRERETQLTTAETKFQVDLAKSDQDQRLNLQTKLQNLALSDKDRADYTAQLKAIDTRETTAINQMKARDDAELKTFERQQQSEAAAKFDAERKATQSATQAKLVAREKEVRVAMGPQLQALGGKFQQQLAEVNKRLASDPKYQAQAVSIHNQMQQRYVSEANQVAASYGETRKMLVQKYSAIAHMQFQDNQAIAMQIQKLASDRRDLYGKIVDQVRLQVQQIAQQRGIAMVFSTVRGAGTAINLTDAVTKAISATPQPLATPASSITP